MRNLLDLVEIGDLIDILLVTTRLTEEVCIRRRGRVAAVILRGRRVRPSR